jgi:hypothetical protein
MAKTTHTLKNTMNAAFWKFDGKPFEPGWYAVLVCYDEQEGAFPGASFWDGAEWDRKAVAAFGEKRDTKEAASLVAYEHDPDA